MCIFRVELRGILRVVQDVRRPSLVLVHPSPVQRAGREDLLLGAAQKLLKVAQLHIGAPPFEHGIQSLRAWAIQLEPNLVDPLPGFLHVYLYTG